MVQKNAYYLNFNTEQFLGGKELLKSMPTFFNRVYFCSKYGNALWDGDKEEYFSNIAMICRAEDLEFLRNIIKNNFLYMADWDSYKYSEKGDYGFSFIAGNIKYILMPFREVDNGYTVRYYDVDNGMCYDVNLEKSKEFFLDSSINVNGDFVRTCDFNIEEINENNSVKHMAEKKLQPEMAVYVSNRGYALANLYLGIVIFALALFVVCIAYMFMRANLT